MRPYDILTNMAIYQQARPYTFDQVIGQEHIKEVLIAALSKGRIGHAYLFSGPRGVGKTTTARLLAMAVNCEHEVVAERPCGVCASCMLVRQASHPDVIELDAASNNSVEDIRDLREKVRLASIRGGSRVWILDEAHMLTKSAANALLKTLEEPPSKLVFILATTEPEKLPPTILSRCQHYRFRRLSEDEIASKLKLLCDKAQVEADAEALKLVAASADGAMRDGESLLERLLSLGRPISRHDAEEALGLPPEARIQALARHLTEQNLKALLAEASQLYRDGFAPRSLAERLKHTLRHALYQQLGVKGYEFSLKLAEKDLLRVIHALDDEADRFVRYDDLFSLEVALMKALNALNHNLPSQALAPVRAIEEAPTRPQPSADEGVPDFDPLARPNRNARWRSEEAQVAAPSQMPNQAKNFSKEVSWHDIKRQANPKLKAFLMPANFEQKGQKLYIRYEESRHNFHFERLKERQHELSELLLSMVGEGYTVYLEGNSGQSSFRLGSGAAPEIQPMPTFNPSAKTKITPIAAEHDEAINPQSAKKSPIIVLIRQSHLLRLG
ncbi:MAG: DNA polymerase III subunit gamma/tau [Deinococcales bacterium]